MISSQLSKAIKKPLKLAVSILLTLNLLILSGCPNSTTPASKNGEPIELTLWHGINPPPNRDVFQTLTDKFNQTHPNIQIKPLYIGQPDQQLPKILIAIVGNAPTDLVWISAILSGKVADLTKTAP